jgi:hypothetical protein
MAQLHPVTILSALLTSACILANGYFAYASARSLRAYYATHGVASSAREEEPRPLAHAHTATALLMSHDGGLPRQLTLHISHERESTATFVTAHHRARMREAAPAPALPVAPLNATALVLRWSCLLASLIMVPAGVLQIGGILVLHTPTSNDAALAVAAVSGLNYFPSLTAADSGAFCTVANKIGVLLYGILKIITFLFFFAKQRAVRPMAKWTIVEQVNAATDTLRHGDDETL